MNCSNYWGEPDGSIDFCEENYKENMYIAEYWNTISASIYFLIGMLWIFTKYKKIAFSFMFLSLGTALWHGTLRYWGQWMDEVGMLILTFNLIQDIHPSLNTQWLGLLLSIYFAFQDIFFIFGGLFVVLQCYIWLCARLMKVSGEWNWTIYNWLLLISMIVWLLDTLYCVVGGLNFHLIWHITTGLMAHFGMRIKNRFDYFNAMLKSKDAREFYLNNT
jgi:dihydroceramidase